VASVEEHSTLPPLEMVISIGAKEAAVSLKATQTSE
jgi:hypothetical protein